MARPKMLKAEKKTYKLQVSLTPAQQQLLEEAATREGLPVASWVRQVALRAARPAEG